MKFTLATLSLAFATADAASLRVQKAVADMAQEANDQVNFKHLSSKIVLQGTTGEPTKEDLAFIGKALVSSYNDVHWEAGHVMNEADTIVPSTDSSNGTFMVDTPIMLWTSWWYPAILCRHCPDDDAMGAAQQSLLLTAVSEDCAGLCNKDATAELEVNFCDRIKSSQGSKYLSSTNACSISFDDHVDVEKIETNDEKSEPVATLDTTIVLKGVGDGEFTQEEQAILAKAFVAAYNDVHWKDNHYLNDAAIPFIAANEKSDSNTLVLDVVNPVMLWTSWWYPAILCRHCPDDDAMGMDAANFDVQTIRTNDFDKQAIEVAFCRKVKNSSSTKLASAESCSLAVETILG